MQWFKRYSLESVATNSSWPNNLLFYILEYCWEHIHDTISISMLKICVDSICVPLEMTFKGNIVPVHKKGDEQNIKSYRPVSLLPICGKIIERLVFNKILSISPLINSFLKTSLVSNPVTLVSTNCYQ